MHSYVVVQDLFAKVLEDEDFVGTFVEANRARLSARFLMVRQKRDL